MKIQRSLVIVIKEKSSNPVVEEDSRRVVQQFP